MITDCQPDAERLAMVQEAMETYGQGTEGADWSWNVLSTRTVVYSCGVMCRAGESVTHNHAEAEMERCKRLAGEAAAIMEGIEVGFGSEAGDLFSPFYVVASVGETEVRELTPESVRAFFGGTIAPEAEITVEALVKEGEWWSQVEADGESVDEEEAEDEAALAWENLMGWFAGQSELRQASMVMIGDSPLSDENGASVFPRMAVALTAAGSVVGIYGHTVHT